MECFKLELKKIVFLGVFNAGKSTILNILSEKYSLISNQKPTKKIERKKMMDVFGYDIINWDFPGQKALREEYINEIDKTLIDTDLIMYIIDVQDYRRILESIKFFKKVLISIEENNMNKVPIFIICHKLDPDVIDDISCISNITYIKEKITSITNSFEIKFFNTTIYDRWTIFFAFSKAFKILIPKSKDQKIMKILEDFAISNNFKSILLMNERNLVINEFSIDSFSSEVINSLALTMSTIYDISVQNELGDQVKIDLLSGVALLIPIKLSDKSNFFLLGYLDQMDLDRKIKNINKTIEDLKLIQGILNVD